MKSLPYLISTEAGSARAPLVRYFDENEDGIRNQLYRHGAVLFRGFDIADQTAFGEVAQRIASPLMDYKGGVAWRREFGNNVYNSTDLAPDRALAAHNEKSYSAAYPDLVLFCCAIPAATGGATPLADGRAVWQRLDPALRDKLRRKRVTYVQNLRQGEGTGKTWMTAYETEDRSAVEMLLLANGAQFLWKPDGSLHVEETVAPMMVHPVTGDEALFCPVDTWYESASAFGGGREGARRAAMELYQYCLFEDGDEIDESIATEIRSAIAAELQEFQWRRGDVLLIDNRLALHGRSPFTGERLILVAMGKDQPS